jgi:hypothetical protein
MSLDPIVIARRPNYCDFSKFPQVSSKDIAYQAIILSIYLLLGSSKSMSGFLSTSPIWFDFMFLIIIRFGLKMMFALHLQ